MQHSTGPLAGWSMMPSRLGRPASQCWGFKSVLQGWGLLKSEFWDQAHVLTLAWQALWHLIHLPSPKSCATYPTLTTNTFQSLDFKTSIPFIYSNKSVCVCASKPTVWRSEDDLHKLVLYFHLWTLGWNSGCWAWQQGPSLSSLLNLKVFLSCLISRWWNEWAHRQRLVTH